VSAAAVRAQFEGDLVLEPPGCEKAGQCISKNALRFTDSKRVVWEAKAGLKTDGASIPPIFQPIIGDPFEREFIKAAVIHDHYCDRHVRPWRQTHRVFYEGLVDQGVPVAKSKVMYYAVYLAGPRWVKLIPGKNCGPNCTNVFFRGGTALGYKVRAAQYDRPGLKEELDELTKVLTANPDSLSLEDLEKRADAQAPNDFYLLSSDSVEATDAMLTE
jgi:hypothetical protein